MPEPPELDGRRAAAIRAQLTDLAPYYAPGWDPDAGGVGAGLVDVFAELGEEVTERLDAAPVKHRIAFFETLGFAARPPQAARVPVQYTLAPDAPRNVAVRPGTAAIAAGSEEVEFHVGQGDAFEATPARLTDVLAVQPDADAIYDHGDVIDGGATVVPWTGEDEQAREGHVGDLDLLWADENEQAHEWYVGDVDLLSAGEGDEVVLEVDTDAPATVFEDPIEWHYYGTAGEDTPEDWHELAPSAGAEEGTVSITLAPDGPLVEYAVEEAERKWIRCRLPPGTDPTGEVAFEVRGLGIKTSSGGSGTPDALLANDVPLQNPGSSDEPIKPFGDQPRPNDAFYVASSTAFTKPGAGVTLTFTPLETDGTETATDGGLVLSQPVETNEEAIMSVAEMDLPQVVIDQFAALADASPDPELSWEYWDGGGWSRIPELDDNTDGFTAEKPATVTFPVPADLEPTTVAGHDGYWIRARLVGGDYGDVIHVPTDKAGGRWARRTTGSPPAYKKVGLCYHVDERQQPAQVRTHNSLAAREHAPGETFQPFLPLPDSEQTLYLGFDAPLSGGPLQLFARIDEHPYPPAFTPRLRWERRHPERAGWIRPEVRDETAGLTEEGLVGLAFAEPTRATSRFGRERHWVRARVTGDEFDPYAGLEAVSEALLTVHAGTVGFASGLGGFGGEIQLMDGGRPSLEPCGDTVETGPPGGEPSREPPTLTGLHFNTGWARNVRRVEDELLGGSDGEREQTFAVSNPPAVDAEVWVDELNALSVPQQEALEAERPDGVDVDRTTDGQVRAFWVRWQAVPDLLDSADDARHFVVDGTAGEVRFGDGTNGRIPPRGSNNVRASYRTGGGAAGNVPEGAVAELKSGLPFVEEVGNPAPGAGGADTESTEAVLDRAPQELKDRNRAVMPADYERLAEAASRRIARARCIPAMDAGGDDAPGHVTVLVVPRESGETPIPSVGLLDRVESSLSGHAPASVVAVDRLVVRGPSYVSVDVQADVVAGDVGSLNAVEERLRAAIAAFLHPLDGRDGEGWPFGELPTRSDVFALLEGVEGVDHVASLFLTFTGTESVVVGEGEAQPSTAADALVRNGEHDLSVALGGGS